ncbi:BlaI/MecI/CopY family transcriptional regulator [Streptomyces cinereospinus]|uniref:BlaI/MecI/CopY family transcriptional regulator n=1 Tax=Streptomyces cinereospinus TaxID=285561 RepID=A0ABV5NAY4_9ACTN
MPRPLGELEDAVMTRVWKWNRPVTVREVLEDLQRERSIAYTTVMTVLDNLHQKGWVRREAEGRAYRYEAVSTRAAYAAALMNDAWSQSDNAAAALVAFFGMMSEEQRQALRDAVRIVGVPETREHTPEAPPRARPVKSVERAEGANARPDTPPQNPTHNSTGTPPENPTRTPPENPTSNPPENPPENPPGNPTATPLGTPTENPGSAPESPGR